MIEYKKGLERVREFKFKYLVFFVNDEDAVGNNEEEK